MNEPSDTRLIEALRQDVTAPPPDDARARLARRLGLGDPLIEAALPKRAVPAPAAGRGRSLAKLASVFVAGGAVGALLHAAIAPAPASHVVYVDRVPAPISAPVPSVASPVAPAPGPPDSVPRAVAAPLPPASLAAVPRPSISQLDAERALLDTARVALVGGDTDTALGALDRHARTYVHPILGEERDAMLVQALVRAGRYDEARTRADAFRRKNPQSLLLPAVDAAIASIP